MSPDLLALARRAVACKGWRWMSGVQDDDGCTVCAASDDGYLLLAGGEGSVVSWWPAASRLPDLTDPATLGCLLALVREAGGEPSLSLIPVDESVPLRWMWTDGGLNAPMAGLWVDYHAFPSEAEALVTALEFAP